jgi:hypothetical protein
MRPRTDRLADRQSQCDFDFSSLYSLGQFSKGSRQEVRKKLDNESRAQKTETFSNSSFIADKRLMGRICLWNFRSILYFGNVMTSVSFYGFGKWQSRKQ